MRKKKSSSYNSSVFRSTFILRKKHEFCGLEWPTWRQLDASHPGALGWSVRTKKRGASSSTFSVARKVCQLELKRTPLSCSSRRVRVPCQAAIWAYRPPISFYISFSSASWAAVPSMYSRSSDLGSPEAHWKVEVKRGASVEAVLWPSLRCMWETSHLHLLVFVRPAKLCWNFNAALGREFEGGGRRYI